MPLSTDKNFRWAGDRRPIDRHHCLLCNVWCAPSRASIFAHEQGYSHKLKAEEAFNKRKREKGEREREESKLEEEIERVRKVGRGSMAKDAHLFDSNGQTKAKSGGNEDEDGDEDGNDSTKTKTKAASEKATRATQFALEMKEKDEWSSKKHKRELTLNMTSTQRKDLSSNASLVDEIKNKSNFGFDCLDNDKEHDNENDNINSSSNGGKEIKQSTLTKRQLSDHTTENSITYLNGQTFSPLLLVDTPVQVYMLSGSNLPMIGSVSVKIDKVSNVGYWVDGLISSVDKDKTEGAGLTFTFSYLKNDEDEDETLISNMTSKQFRIQCNGGEGTPFNIDIARVILLNGATVILDRTADDVIKETEIDEDTGIGGWSTVSTRTVTVAMSRKEEEQRVNSSNRQARIEEAQRKKEGEARKMEIAKFENKEDSALGSYDVYGNRGYKGVDISKGLGQSQGGSGEVVGKSLGEWVEGGSGVGFKSGKGKGKRGNNRRKTEVDE